jgi:L-aspartate oxidase
MPLIDPARAQLPVVIIGAGLAGLTVALHLAVDHPVIVLAKRGLDEGATAWAQGGIVGVLGERRQHRIPRARHAGGRRRPGRRAHGPLHRASTAPRPSSGWSNVACRSRDPAGPLGLHLTREGGHAVRRIAHAADATGKAIHDVLLDEVRRHPNITCASAGWRWT